MDPRLTRRGFLRLAGLSGAALLAPGAARAQAASSPAAPGTAAPSSPRPIPTRALGKSGVKVPILGLGGMFDTRSAQLLLRQSLSWGVSYWDTADCYENGNSEEGFGRFFQRSPADREKVFLATKSDTTDPAGMTALLDQSLKRLNTSYIDLYLIHGVRDRPALGAAVKDWAAHQKAEGRIRLFGFSTHKFMQDLLAAAASLGWIDAVMSAVNYRLVNEPAMAAALDACRKAGVGVIGMKFKGGGPIPSRPDAQERLAADLVRRGSTPEQAMLKALWENPAIASVCASMTTFGALQEYASAALDPRGLSDDDRGALDRYADDSRGTFCRACGACERASGGAPIPDALRCLMYEESYGDGHRARDAWRALSPEARESLRRVDPAAVEGACPHGLPIGRLLADAERRFRPA